MPANTAENYILQIQEMENQLVAAMKNSDVEMLDRLLHDDLLFVIPGGQTVTKEMDLDSHRAGNMIIEEALATTETIAIIDTVAVVTVVLEAKGKMLGQPLAGTFKYIRVWKLCDGSWKIIGGSCTEMV